MMRGDWGVLGSPSAASLSDQRRSLSRAQEKAPCMSAGAFPAGVGASSCERGAFKPGRAGTGQPAASSAWAAPRVHLGIDVQVGVLRRRGSAGGHTRALRSAGLQCAQQQPCRDRLSCRRPRLSAALGLDTSTATSVDVLGRSEGAVARRAPMCRGGTGLRARGAAVTAPLPATGTQAL